VLSCLRRANTSHPRSACLPACLLQNSALASNSLTGQRASTRHPRTPDAGWPPVDTEYAAFNSVSHILMLLPGSSLVSQHSRGFSTWVLCGYWDAHMGVGDSKSSRHMLPQMKAGHPAQHSHPLSVHPLVVYPIHTILIFRAYHIYISLILFCTRIPRLVLGVILHGAV
jgi:hypothetical protein